MDNGNTWQPFASPEMARQRAALYQKIREFMSARRIMEVDTPFIGRYGITDTFIDSVQATSYLPGCEQLYLHTSPEFCMKRLLAAGYGDIYQLAHVFRDGEQGRHHSLEFTMLEWYRMGLSYRELMDEVAELVMELGLEKPSRKTYSQVFLDAIQIDPVHAKNDELCQLAKQTGWDSPSAERHELLDFIFSHLVIKQIEQEKSLIIHDYPVCMAALSKRSQDNPDLCERFELFIDGLEIANGFTELTDVEEQQQRFNTDIQQREKNNRPCPPLDNHFLAALKSGLPDCAGVAVGLDRLLMKLTGRNDIKDVHSFTLHNN